MKFEKKGDFNIDKINRKYVTTFARNTPVIIANEVENHFKEGFRKGGGQTDDSKNGWKQRAFTKGRGKRNILVGRGTLQRDVLKRRTTKDKIVVGTSSLTKNYAEIHNKGGRIRVTSKMRAYFFQQAKKTKDKQEKEFFINLATTKKAFIEIPKREYIGKSGVLETKIQKILYRELDKLYQQ